MKHFLILLTMVVHVPAFAQDPNDYYEIPSPPEKYSAATVAARLLDGLGYRYYWATAGLSEDDLSFRPNSQARSSQETIDHVWGLSVAIRCTALQKRIDFSQIDTPEGFEAKRNATLENIKIASLILRGISDEDLGAYPLIFAGTAQDSTYPFWNGINGPIADAIWHAGQLASFRRSSGNPINPKASMLTGEVSE